MHQKLEKKMREKKGERENEKSHQRQNKMLFVHCNMFVVIVTDRRWFGHILKRIWKISLSHFNGIRFFARSLLLFTSNSLISNIRNANKFNEINKSIQILHVVLPTLSKNAFEMQGENEWKRERERHEEMGKNGKFCKCISTIWMIIEKQRRKTERNKIEERREKKRLEKYFRMVAMCRKAACKRWKELCVESTTLCDEHDDRWWSGKKKY